MPTARPLNPSRLRLAVLAVVSMLGGCSADPGRDPATFAIPTDTAAPIRMDVCKPGDLHRDDDGELPAGREMTEQAGRRSPDWPALGLRSGPRRDPFAEWYEAWSVQYAAHRAAEEGERARMRREIRWMSGLIAAWSLAMGGAAVFAIWIVL